MEVKVGLSPCLARDKPNPFEESKETLPWWDSLENHCDFDYCVKSSEKEVLKAVSGEQFEEVNGLHVVSAANTTWVEAKVAKVSKLDNVIITVINLIIMLVC